MKVIDDIGLAFSLASAIPPAVEFVDTELPTVEQEVVDAYNSIKTPAEAIIADVELVIKSGAATAVTQEVEKTVSDFGALVAAVETVYPKALAEGEAEYAKLLPVLTPLATALKISLPAAPAAA